MGVPLRKLWKNKPKQYGPFSVVQNGLFTNLERMGIDPRLCIMAIPAWGSGNPINYVDSISKVNIDTDYKNNTLSFNGSSSFVQLGLWPVHEQATFFAGVKFKADKNWDQQIATADSNAFPVARTFQFRRGRNSGKLELIVFYSGGNNQVTGSTLLEFGERHDVAGRADGTDLRVYVDSKLDSTPVAAGGYIDLVAGGWALGAFNSRIDYSTPSQFADMDLSYYYAFSIGLEEPIISLLSDNPYQLWQPVPQKTIFLPQDGGGLTLNLSDTITLSDAIINSIRLNKADTISISDTFSKTLNLNKSDVISLSDEISKSVNIFKSDTITLSDQISTLIALTLILSDTITMSDSISKQPGIVKADTIIMGDAFSKVSEFVRTFSDQINMSDQISKEIGITKADIITLSDTFSTSEEVIYALVNFLAKDRVFNFTAKNKTFNFGADPRGKKP